MPLRHLECLRAENEFATRLEAENARIAKNRARIEAAEAAERKERIGKECERCGRVMEAGDCDYCCGDPNCEICS
jgi:hypothetical protein